MIISPLNACRPNLCPGPTRHDCSPAASPPRAWLQNASNAAPGGTALEQCVREVTVPPRALLTLRLRSGQVPHWHRRAQHPPHPESRTLRPARRPDATPRTLNPAPAPQAHAASSNGEKPINPCLRRQVFQLGCLFVIRSSQKVLPHRQRAAGLPPVATRGREQGETDRLEAYPTQFGSFSSMG